MTNIKLLEITDLEQIADLLSNQKTYFGIEIKDLPFELSNRSALLSLTNLYLREDNPYYRSYGWVENGKISAILNADFMRDQPFWILRRMVIAEELKGTGSTHMIGELMGEILRYAEPKGYKQHYNLIPAKYKKAHLKIWGEHQLRKDRYDVVEVENVKANEPSKFRLFWELLYGRITYPVDTCVRMSVLKREHRGE